MGQADLIPVARYLAAPGVSPSQRDVGLSFTAEGVQTHSLSAPADNGILALAPPVNAHDHGYGIRTLDFGCYDDALEPWIAGLRNRPRTDPYLEALVAFGRLAKNGCGATMHCHNSLRADRLGDEVEAVARAAKDSGIRVALSCPLLDDSAWVYGGPKQLRHVVAPEQWPAFEVRMPTYAPFKEQLAAAEDCIKRHRGGQFDVQLGPIGPQWCSNGMLEAIAETSDRLDCRIHMHLLESPRQRVWLDQRFPGGVVQFLDSIGFLSSRLAVAHGVQLRPEECELLAERDVIVASNPSANLRLRSGIAPVEAYREAGLSYAIGMDGTSFSDDQDIWEEMRLFHLLHGGQGLDPAIANTELFKAVTQTGAKVLGLPMIDDLTGDLVTLNFDAMMAECLEEATDEASAILTRMTRHYVEDLYVAGKPVVRSGKVISFDYDAALGELVAQARHASGEKDDEERAFVGTLAGAIRQHYASQFVSFTQTSGKA